MYRQGDVLIVEHPGMPENVRIITPPVVLAEGEATGHAHVAKGQVDGFVCGQQLYLHVQGAARVVHPEHLPIALPSGWYRVVRQREYGPSDTWHVAD